jgi:tetratricopeptide (TPR) repeat protein
MSDNLRLEDLRRRIQEDPASIAFAQLAEEYRRAGRHEEAVDLCRTGLATHPGYLSARVTLGRALGHLERLDEAQNEFELVLQSAPQNLAAIRGLAEIHRKRGATSEAMAQYRAALVLAPNDPELERTVRDLSQSLAQTVNAREHERALSVLAALQQWLVAVHVTRAQRSA